MPRVPGGASLIERYAAYLPVTDRTPRLSLGEGNTPLVRAPTLERELGIGEVWLKVEGQNPTGSFKDRGMVVAVAKAVEDGARVVLCASTGNTAASAAAYGKGCNGAVRGGRARTRPKMYGYQAAGAAPLVSGKPVSAPETVATAIRVGNPASWRGAVAARDESGGAIDAVTDEEILDAYGFVARCE